MQARTLVLLFILILPTASSIAGTARYGTVDMTRLFAAYPGTRAAQARYDAVAQEKQRELRTEGKALDVMRESYSKKRVSMTPVQCKVSENGIKKAFEDFEAHKKAVLDEMKARETAVSQGVVDHIRSVVARVAKDKKLDVVFDSEKVIYVRDAVDLTPDVMEQFVSDEKKARQ